MSRQAISPKRPARMQRYPYRANRPWPHEVSDGPGPLQMDALSGNWFPAIYAVDGPFGQVDGRNGAVVDLDADQHEMAVTMVGQQPNRILPNG